MKNKESNLSIPSWFSLARYEHVSEFTSRDWYFALCTRKLFFEKLLEGLDQEYYDNLIAPMFRENGVFLPETDVPRNPQESGPQFHAIVGDMKIISVLDFSDNILAEAKFKEDWARWNETADLGNYLEESINSFRPHISSNIVYAEVDINSPEDIAVEAFRAWFSEKKTERKKGTEKDNSIARSEFAKWARYQILAYLDLKLWSDIHKNNLPHWLTAGALFPNWDGDTSEIVRKTTIKLANRATDFKTINALAIQARIETGPL
ncbi:MAG TPA: DUF6387 family protein [Burkholderiaceae bacterium]